MPGKKSKGSDAKVKAAAAALREEGELEKLSMNSLVNRYQKRWFVLSAESLAYFTDQETAAAARRPEEGKLVLVKDMTDCSPLKELELIVHSRGRVLQLRAATAAARDRWVAKCLQAVERFRTSDFTEVLEGGADGEDEAALWKGSLRPARWRGVEQPFALDKVFKESAEFADVAARFAASLPAARVLRVVRVQSRAALAAFRKFRADLVDTVAGEGRGTCVRTLRVWHGCSAPERLAPICAGGFRAGSGERRTGVDQYGKGCYFARDAALAARYAARLSEEAAAALAEHPARLVGARCVLLALFAAGDVAEGSHDRPRPLRIPGLPSGRRFDTMADRADDPSIVVATAEAQAYPAYIVCFE